MRWENHFAMASAGTHVLYRLDPDRGENVFVVMSIETGEPTKWIVSREAVLGWLCGEADLSIEEARFILWGSDEWVKLRCHLPPRQDAAARPS